MPHTFEILYSVYLMHAFVTISHTFIVYCHRCHFHNTLRLKTLRTFDGPLLRIVTKAYNLNVFLSLDN